MVPWNWNEGALVVSVGCPDDRSTRLELKQANLSIRAAASASLDGVTLPVPLKAGVQ
jgi:hypothetical protein